MSVECVDRIVFRFTRRELSALLKLMNKPELPGMLIYADDPDQQTIDSLSRNGIVTLAGDRIFADQVIAMILHTATASRKYVTLTTDDKRAVLYFGGRLLVLMEDFGGNIVTVEPLENLSQAQASWDRAVGRIGNALRIIITDGEKADELLGDAEQMQRIVHRFFDSEVK